MNKRSLQGSPSSFPVLTVEARPCYTTGIPPMANRRIAGMPAAVAAARIRLPMSIQKLVARRFCTPTKNEAACVASLVCPGSIGQPCPVGSKKRATPGFGSPCAARRVKWSPMQWAIEAGKTCQRLWEAIPASYRQGHCFTDYWEAYKVVIPEKQHTAVGKETGETAHVERWNNTLRKPLALFVRMTLSFSKSEVMHETCLAPLSSSIEFRQGYPSQMSHYQGE